MTIQFSATGDKDVDLIIAELAKDGGSISFYPSEEQEEIYQRAKAFGIISFEWDGGGFDHDRYRATLTNKGRRMTGLPPIIVPLSVWRRALSALRCFGKLIPPS